MKKIKFSLFAILAGSIALSVASCNNSDENKKTDETIKTDNLVTNDTSTVNNLQGLHAMASLAGTVADTALSGTVEFFQLDGKVTMHLNILSPKMAGKSVAVHFHEMGDCGDMGKMAHGHWNPTGKQHGKWGSENFHAGDIGNIPVDKDGKAVLELQTDLWSIGGDSTKNILGRSIIVHSGVDDYKTQPTGNSGSRIGCGVIAKQ